MEMRYDIGIPAYNEEKNIKALLTSIITYKPELHELNSIIVVSSGSTDRTNEIVQEMAKKNPIVKLVIEKKRRGQASAYNLLLQNSKADVIIILDADIALFENSIYELLKEFNKGTFTIGGHILPVLTDNCFINNLSLIFYLFHNLFSILFQTKISGKFFALRNNVIKSIPRNINCSDAYIQILAEMKNLKVKYSKNAKILAVPPQTILEFIKEQRRITTGHLQLKKITGRAVKTMGFLNLFKLIIKSFRYFLYKRKVNYLFAFLFLKFLSTFLSYIDVFRGNYRTIWNVIKSTKTIR